MGQASDAQIPLLHGMDTLLWLSSSMVQFVSSSTGKYAALNRQV